MSDGITKQQYDAFIKGRAYMPHCDQRVLHRPGTCVYCDKFPDLQHAREVMMINFTDTNDRDKVPCPSTWFRSRETIERWPGNRATPEE